MNNIGNLINNLEEELLNLWKEHASTQVKTKVVFTDFYDLIFNLWEQKIITDSRISMDALNLYYRYKKYRYLSEDDMIYIETEPKAKEQFEDLISRLR